MAVQGAKRVFGVAKTIGRLDDPARKDAYRALDVQFVPSARLTSKVVHEQLVQEEFAFHVAFSGGDVEIVDMDVPSATQDSYLVTVRKSSDGQGGSRPRAGGAAS